MRLTPPLPTSFLKHFWRHYVSLKTFNHVARYVFIDILQVEEGVEMD
jgi:hypothetical protein